MLRRPLRILIAGALPLVLASCGTRLDHTQIRADAGLESGGRAAATSAIAPSSADEASGTPMTESPTTAPAAASNRVAAAANATPAAAGAGPGGPATGSPIVIGQVGSFSGLAGGPQKPGQTMLQVWARWTNAHGGINGHPVKVVSADDGGDANKSASLVQDMVENKHVVAFVAQFVPLTFSATKNYAQAHDVPVIGGDDTSPDWFQNTMFFPHGSYINAMTVGTVKTAVAAGHDKLAVLYCIESASCTNLYNTVKDGGATQAGAQLVYAAQISLGTLNFQSQCQQAKDKGATALFVGADGATASRVARDCSQIGYHPQYLTSALAVSNAQAQDPNLDGLTIGSPQFPWINGDTPAERAYQDAIKTYAPGLEASGSAATAWASAELFRLAASRIPADQPVTSSSLLTALWGLGPTDNSGLSPTLTFHKGQPPSLSNCYFAMVVKGGRWTAPNGSKPTCV